MKISILSLIIITFTSTVFAASESQKTPETPRFPKGKGAVLVDPLKEGTVYGSLEKISGKGNVKDLRLLGHLVFDEPKDKMLSGNKFVLIGWMGVQKINDPSKIVMLKEPIVSSFVINKNLDVKNLVLPTFGEEKYLKEAILRLESGEGHPADLKLKRKIQIPSGQPEHLLTNQTNDSGYNGASNNIQGNTDSEAKPDPKKGYSSEQDPSTIPNSKGSNTKQKQQNQSRSNSNKDGATRNSTDFSYNDSYLSDFQQRQSGGYISKPYSSGYANPEDPSLASKDSGKKNDKEFDFGPDLNVELTEDGCLPEHDENQETITITKRTRTYENGQLTIQGNCERTLESYGTKRDYLCENCKDEINKEELKAYPRYQEYWFNRDNKRHNLKLKVDKQSPFEIVENTEGCGFDTETEKDFVIKMSRLGYVNKFGIFKTVEDCRVSDNAKRYPIIQTSKGCDLIHHFDNEISYEQKRNIFIANGIEHEVSSCYSINPVLKHEYVEMGCKPINDLSSGKTTRTARRRIKTSSGYKFITADCEPRDTTHLLTDRKKCKGLYVHDFAAGKSYVKKRFYILRDHDLHEYVTGCIRTDDYLPHKTEHHGEWVHEDSLRVSKPKLSLYIDSLENGKLKLEEPKVRSSLGQVQYTYVKDRVQPTANYYFEGCFRRTRTDLYQIYTRADNSIYELFVGAGNPIISTVDECTRAIVDKKCIGSSSGPSNILKSPYGQCIVDFVFYSQRIMTTYPDGRIVYGPYYEVSEERPILEQSSSDGKCHKG